MAIAKSKKELVASFAKDRATLERIAKVFTNVVQRSFEEDREGRMIYLTSDVPTTEEIKRRTNICYDWFLTLRGDLHYSNEKALDFIGKALRATLDGVDFEPPPADASWGGEAASR